VWDVVVVGSGPAGAAAAVAACHTDPQASVLLLDRSGFPRDKCCGDAVLNSGVRELARYGVDPDAVLSGYASASRMELVSAGGQTIVGDVPGRLTVIPRMVFDSRLLAAARDAGAVWRRGAIREVRDHGDHVELDGSLRARVVIGADGAESLVRRAVDTGRRRDVAVALRGYDLAAGNGDGNDLARMVFTHRGGLSYAWRFPSSSGEANVGFGHLLRPGEHANRSHLLATMHRLLPGIELRPGSLRAHRLPLATSGQPAGRGRILLAGDAAALVNPLSGEGIYYAIASGLAAGRAAVTDPATAAASYCRSLRRQFGAHHVHAAVLSALTASRFVVEAGLRAGADPAVFADLARLGLADGRITARLVLGLVRHLVGHRASPDAGLLAQYARAT
jgi:geranylgeranyl reductase family protein